MKFEDLNLAPAIVQAVREHGYETPTPIQVEAIPAVLAGRDLLGGAQTGTGKTAAFTLPMLQRLSQGERGQNRFGGNAIRALVLTPTRELAAQVEESVRVYGKHLSLTSTVVFGGVGMNPQINAMKKGVDILVATPGRLLDLQQQGFLDLSQVQILVLDEADRMLDMGFIHDVKKVLALLPQSKQSLLFSATFSDEIRDLANNLLKDPQSIQVTPRNTTVQRITQVIHPVGTARRRRCWCTSSISTTGARCWCSPAPSSAPTMWPNSWKRTASPRWRCTATRASRPAPRPCKASRPEKCAP